MKPLIAANDHPDPLSLYSSIYFRKISVDLSNCFSIDDVFLNLYVIGSWDESGGNLTVTYSSKSVWIISLVFHLF